MQTYIVQPGDTLYGISKQFGVTVEEIKLENNLTSDTVGVGQVLKIPTILTTSLYVVKKGDTLYSIATRYGTTVNELMKVNNLTSTSLSVGQQLNIPISGDETGNNYVLYSVKVGDNLYSIAKKNNTTVDAIKELNGLTSNLLSIGQQLKIPISVSTTPEDYQTYTVRSGDTLYKIANIYGMSVDELIQINNLTTTNLTVGQVLKVKQNYFSDISLGSACYGTGYQEPTYLTYTVKNGDSLYVIARRYNTSVENLIKLNNLTSNNLSIGQVLKIREIDS